MIKSCVGLSDSTSQCMSEPRFRKLSYPSSRTGGAEALSAAVECNPCRPRATKVVADAGLNMFQWLDMLTNHSASGRCYVHSGALFGTVWMPHECAIRTNRFQASYPCTSGKLSECWRSDGHLQALSAGMLRRTVHMLPGNEAGRQPIGESELKLQKFFKLGFYKLIISTRHLDGDIAKPSLPPPPYLSPS